jgi:predicted permease
MRETFLRDHARVRAAGRGALAAFWIVTIAQALWFGACERARAARAARAGVPMHTPDTLVRASGTRFRWAIFTDARYAVRLLARSPLFTTTSILSLAVGIAVSTIMFGVADALFFQASPGVRDSGRIVDIARTTNGSGDGPIARVTFEYVRAHTQTLEGMAASPRNPIALSLSSGAGAGEGAGSERVYGSTVSGTFFEVLGLRPALGRFFRAGEDERADPRPVVVLSHRFWREHLRADPRVLDRPLRLNNIPFDVIGVAEAGFDGTMILGADLWTPIAMAGALRASRGGDPASIDDAVWNDVRAVGRLRPRVTRAAAQAELNTLVAALKADTPSIPAQHGLVVDASGRLPPRARSQFAAFVALISVLAGGLLAIACSNVAGMLLARATTRRHEMATRLAMGAGRGQLIGQMLIETLVLFAAAGVVALPLALWLGGALQSFLPTNLPVPIRFELAFTVRTVLFAAGLSLAAGVLFGLAPARHALRADLSRMFHGRSATDSRDRLRLRHGLVAAQVALSLAMVITAGLFVRTLLAASQIDTGFKTAGVTVVAIDTSLADAAGARTLPLVTRLVDRLRAIGGVEAVGLGRVVPLEGSSFRMGRIRVAGADVGGGAAGGAGGAGDARSARLADTDWDIVSPDYFRAVGLPLAAGRAFTSADREGSPRVAIVNEAFARAAWPGQPAVGQRFWQIAGAHEEEQPFEVVGVVGDARYRYINEAPRTQVYVAFEQYPQTKVELFVKHAAGQSVASDIRAAIAGVEPRLPVVLMRSFDEAAAVTLLPQRFAAWVAGVVGGIGILLAALGLYGLAAFMVAQRTREIAIRMALGASQADVRSLVLAQAARLGLAGTAAGLLLASALGRLVQHLSLLVGVPPTDPLTFGSVALLLAAVLFAASYIPARRAASTDPASALRAQ